MSERNSIGRGAPGRDDTERNERFQAVLLEILPEVRRRHPGYSDERVFVTAINLAVYRLWKDVVQLPEPDDAA